MRTLLAVVLVFAFGIYMFGCGKKESTEMQEQMSMESLATTPAVEVTPASETGMPQAPAAMPAASEPAVAAKLEPLPPAGPYKPGALDIQTALKNAGYYTGALDGKIGPMTKNAVKEFQKANNLAVDGRVGPKTWEVLKAYLSAPSQRD